MLLWVEPFIWRLIGILSYAMQLIGLLGLLAMGMVGLMNLTDKILEVQDGNEDQDRSGKEDPSLQPGLR